MNRWFGKFLFIIAFIFSLLSVLILLNIFNILYDYPSNTLLPSWLYESIFVLSNHNQKNNDIESFIDLLTIFLTTAAGTTAGLRIIINSENQLENQLDQARIQLGDNSSQIRKQAILLLGKIARQSNKRKHFVVRLLIDHIKSRCPKNSKTTDNSETLEGDIQFALETLINIKPREINLQETNLKDANFRSLNLRNIDFSCSKFLFGADFIDANLENVKFEKAHLEEIIFRKAKFISTDFSHAHLEYTNFGSSYLESTKFIHACLNEAKFEVTIFKKNVDFEYCRLVNASFTNAEFEDVNFKGAVLKKAKFEQTLFKKKPDFSQCTSLSGANFQGANLSGANFQGADLSGANFQGANLSGANFQGADLSGANFQGANLSGANFRGANLLGANVTPAQIKSACFWKTAIYKGNWDNDKETWILDEKANQKYIEELKINKASDPKEKVDCSMWKKNR